MNLNLKGVAVYVRFHLGIMKSLRAMCDEGSEGWLWFDHEAGVCEENLRELEDVIGSGVDSVDV